MVMCCGMTSSGFFAPPFTVSEVNKSLESLMLCVMCAMVVVVVVDVDVHVHVDVVVAVAVADTVVVDVHVDVCDVVVVVVVRECLVIQRVIFRAFQPLTTVEVKTRAIF